MLQKLKKVLKAYLEMQVCVILGLKLRKIAHLAQNIIILEILLKWFLSFIVSYCATKFF